MLLHAFPRDTLLCRLIHYIQDKGFTEGRLSQDSKNNHKSKQQQSNNFETKMVLFVNSNPDSNRRLSLVFKGTLILSWRSLKKDLGQETRDDSYISCIRSEELSPQRRVRFSSEQLVTEIPEEGHPITEQELRRSWCKVCPLRV